MERITSVIAMEISFKLNGEKVTASVAPQTLLVDMLRDTFALTGTHVGCDTSQCGACVVHVDDRSIKSCSLLAAQVAGASVVTIEGLAKGDSLHPLQSAFRDEHGLQCGFCTPGMIMSALELLQKNPQADDEEIRHWLEGNLCRCTGYQNIIRAVKAAGRAMTGARV